MPSRVLALFAFLPIVAFSQQPNSSDASLVINGFAGPPYPIPSVTVFSGVSATMVFAGLSGSPITLGQSPTLEVGFANTPIGIVDLNLAASQLLLTGQRSLDFNGTLTLAIPAPLTLPAGLNMAYQCAILSLTAPAGAVLSAATRITTGIGVIGGTLTLPDDGFASVNLVPHGLSAPFYSNSYSVFYVNSNGDVSFNSGSSDFTATPSELLSGPPRICSCWHDQSPNVGGTISWTVDYTVPPLPTLAVRYANIPSGFAAGGLFTHSVRLELNPVGVFPPVGGTMQLINPVNNPASPYDTVVGISPGSNLSTQTTAIDLSAAQIQGGHTGGPMQAIFEFFTGTTSTTGVPGGFWDLTGSSLTFLAIGVGQSGAAYYMF